MPGKRLVLLVEGPDDREVVHQLMNHYHLRRGVVDVKDKVGYENLRATIRLELADSEVECVGIVVDADANLQDRWQSLRDVLLPLDYDVPSAPDPGGTIIHRAPRPTDTLVQTLGLWVMPDNTLPGMLEHFVSFLVPPGDNLWPHAEKTVQGISGEMRRFPSQHEIKARVHTWLAWQEEPGKPMGLAITKCYLDANCQQASLFVAWLRRLFEL